MNEYGAILIDPPWEFRVWNKETGNGRSAESHYPTMTLNDLKTLKLPMAKDCAVFMWATMPTLYEALALGQAWGLTYKTAAFVWAKTNKSMIGRFAETHDQANYFMGMGYWTRANTELCLLFTHGKPKRLAKDVRQLIVAPIGKHSAKPVEQYERIERLVCGPYLEIFARQPREGWDSIGNAIDGRDIREVLKA